LPIDFIAFGSSDSGFDLYLSRFHAELVGLFKPKQNKTEKIEKTCDVCIEEEKNFPT
jgi:hypothetical protein